MPLCAPRLCLIRSARLNIPAWHVGLGEGAWGRTEPDTKTAGLSPEWHPSHLSYPKPQMPACAPSLQPAERTTRGNYGTTQPLQAEGGTEGGTEGAVSAALLFGCGGSSSWQKSQGWPTSGC